jgi:very-short-patch-repair endonuclease
MHNELNNFLNLFSIGEALFKSKADIYKKHTELLVLYEEKLEMQLIKAFNDSKKDVLNKLVMLDKYINKTFLNKYLPELIEYPLEPRYKFIQIGDTRFKEYTFSVEIRDWMLKSGIGDDIGVVTSINSNPFKTPISDAQLKSYVTGGQTVFNIFDVGIDFALRDKNVEKYYENYAIKLSQQVTKELQSKIKFEILEGIKNAESIPKIRNRILGVYNKPIDVAVKPKLNSAGDIIRQGYTYQMSPTNWANTVARTEVMGAYTKGRLEGFKLGGVVEKVEYSVSPDERLCEICAPLGGGIYKLEDADGVIPQHPNCLVHPNSPVYTADGWKKIVDIKVNDLVLTHKGKFRKVIQLHRNKYDGEVVKLFFGEKRTADKKSISLTAKHPLIINGKWNKANEARVGDKAKILVHSCSNCETEIPYWDNFCSNKCRKEYKSKKATKQLINEYKNGTRVGSKIVKGAHKEIKRLSKLGLLELQINSDRVKGKNNVVHTNRELFFNRWNDMKGSSNPMKSKKLKKAMSVRLKKLYQEHPEKHPNYILSQMARNKNGGMTDIEILMANELNKYKIDYSYNFQVLNYWIDFAIPELKIGIECDGEYWHKDKAKDKKRDNELSDAGWTMLRFPGKEIHKDVNGCVDKIIRVACNHKGMYKFQDIEITDIKYNNKKVATYNLSVEKDESYVYNGIVVHNCRCQWIPLIGGEFGEEKDKFSNNVRDAYNLDEAYEYGKTGDVKSQ